MIRCGERSVGEVVLVGDWRVQQGSTQRRLPRRKSDRPRTQPRNSRLMRIRLGAPLPGGRRRRPSHCRSDRRWRRSLSTTKPDDGIRSQGKSATRTRTCTAPRRRAPMPVPTGSKGRWLGPRDARGDPATRCTPASLRANLRFTEGFRRRTPHNSVSRGFSRLKCRNPAVARCPGCLVALARRGLGYGVILRWCLVGNNERSPWRSSVCSQRSRWRQPPARWCAALQRPRLPSLRPAPSRPCINITTRRVMRIIRRRA